MEKKEKKKNDSLSPSRLPIWMWMENDKRLANAEKENKRKLFSLFFSLSLFLSSPDLDVENDKRLANAEKKWKRRKRKKNDSLSPSRLPIWMWMENDKRLANAEKENKRKLFSLFFSLSLFLSSPNLKMNGK